MTIFERVEDLTRRVGELEARVPKAFTTEAAPVLGQIGPGAVAPCNQPIGALEAISDDWQERSQSEYIASRLEQLASDQPRIVDAYFTRSEWKNVVSLARARVAPEKP